MSSVYLPVIDSMQWSYSRLKSFETCRYAWYLKYLYGLREKPNFFASYGSFVHNLIEKYYRDEISLQDLPVDFLKGFSYFVVGMRPKEEIVDRYMEAGFNYFRAFKPIPYEMVSVEDRVEFCIDGREFVGFVDFIGKNGDELAVVDHKSRDLKPRTGRKKPTKSDDELSQYLRQLYLYSIGVNEKYRMTPKRLCFNCFRSGVFIDEPFDDAAFEDAKTWAIKTIETIRRTEDFFPTFDWFYCTYLCGFNDECCYYEIMKAGDRHGRSGY